MAVQLLQQDTQHRLAAQEFPSGLSVAHCLSVCGVSASNTHASAFKASMAEVSKSLSIRTNAGLRLIG